MWLRALLLVSCSCHVTWGYSTGAPTRSCGDMTPGHGSPINTDPVPFLVEVSKTRYAPNERIYGMWACSCFLSIYECLRSL
ncbi:hypothetical protein DPMN_056988 [Dreissena polymorpha]|uniref:Secreted protein n=1 Tax=Dreissena polymorpha TaxID=45954 RepID=A0A9D4CVM4_DREPO|nr:hypothetical protein DPMN_056988 [Dreissena polymorpha]